MPDHRAREIVMRLIAEAVLAGDSIGVEDGKILAHALGILPHLDSDLNPRSSKPLQQIPVKDKAVSASEVDAVERAIDVNRVVPAGGQSANGMSKRKEARERGRLAKQSFFSTLSENGIRITHVRNREYRTSKGKVLAIAFATEDSRGDLWWSGSEDKHYDAIVFLCWTGDQKLLYFVVPWSAIATHWNSFSRSHRAQVEFHVKRNASGYALEIPHGIGLSITSYLWNLDPLRG